MSILSNLVARTNALVANQGSSTDSTEAVEATPEFSDAVGQLENGAEVPEGAGPRPKSIVDPIGPAESISRDEPHGSLRELFAAESTVVDPQLEALLRKVTPVSAQELITELRALTSAIARRTPGNPA